MRTKTLLLTAALSAAGIATSMAQVYSVNAVGYVNTTLNPGFNLVSNPLVASDNKIKTLFAEVGAQAGAQNADVTIFKFTSTGYKIAAWDQFDNTFLGDGAEETVMPGEGVFVQNPLATALTVTFVGEVMQSTTTTPLSTPLPSGLSIKSSQVPVAGAAALEGLPAQNGDTFFRFDSNTGYTVSGFELGEWDPPLPTNIRVGEAFFYQNGGAARNWTRSFNVNQ